MQKAICSLRFAPKCKFSLAIPVSLPRGPPRAHPASTEAQKAHPSFGIETTQPDSRGFTQNHAEEPPLVHHSVARGFVSN